MRRLRLITSLALTSAGIGGLVAAQLPATSSSAVVALPSQPGSAFATATMLAANPEYGGLSLVARAGQATASYTGSQSVANSQAVNLGFLGGTSIGILGACTGGGSTSPTTTPSPTAALNALLATSASGAAGKSADGGIEAVTVNPSPESAGATTKMVPVTVPGFLTVTAQSASHVAYTSGQEQEADANSTMTVSLLGGLITLDGLTWTASQESGSKNASTATFTMGSVTVGSTTTAIVGPTQLAFVISLVNKVLGTFGLSLTLPTASTDTVTNAITISPLQLQLTGTALVNSVLSKLTPTQTTLEQDIAKALATFNSACLASLAGTLGTGELLASIVEGILAGGGVVELQLGGASADTQDAPDFVNPLAAAGAGSGDTDVNQSGSSVLGIGSGDTSGFNGLGTGAGATSAPNPAPAAGTKPATHPQSAGAPVALVRCVSSSPANRPGCWSGAATVAAAALLLAGGGLFATDFVRSRRKRLSRPKETL